MQAELKSSFRSSPRSFPSLSFLATFTMDDGHASRCDKVLCSVPAANWQASRGPRGPAARLPGALDQQASKVLSARCAIHSWATRADVGPSYGPSNLLRYGEQSSRVEYRSQSRNALESFGTGGVASGSSPAVITYVTLQRALQGGTRSNDRANRM